MIQEMLQIKRLFAYSCYNTDVKVKGKFQMKLWSSHFYDYENWLWNDCQCPFFLDISFMTVRDVFKISICCGTSVLASFRSIEVIISDEVLIWSAGRTRDLLHAAQSLIRGQMKVYKYGALALGIELSIHKDREKLVGLNPRVTE